MTSAIGRPAADEYAPFYAGYVGRVPDGDILAILAGQLEALTGMLGGLSDEEARSRFAPGEWSIKEVVGHLGDAERIFSARALCFARGEAAALPGFDQDAYVAAAGFDARPLADLLDELTLLRRANLVAYRHLTPDTGLRRGVASGAEVSVRALVCILAGHFDYHLADLREQYLPALGR
jgi:hypothetical protein